MGLLARRCIETFAQLGRPLGPADAVPAETIGAAGAVLWQCAFGGAMPVRGIARVEPGARASLASRLEFVGEVNEMGAFLGPGLAACLVPWDDGWRIFAGARDDAALAPPRDLGMSPSIATPLGS